MSPVTTPIARVTPAAPAEPVREPTLLEDIDGLFIPPVPLPDPRTRAQLVAAQIDWSQDTIVIWVPGTNGSDVHPGLAQMLAANGGRSAVALRYSATWRLIDSVPDGEAALDELLQLIAQRKRPGQRVVLIGESQGAWIISSLLRRPQYAALVHRAALLSHPALAPAHVHESTSFDERLSPSQVREYNSEQDVAAFELGRSADRVLKIVDSFARLNVGAALLGALGIAFTNPSILQALIASQMFRMRGERNPHNPIESMRDAVEWMLQPDAPAPTS